ncbi:hypothetical protein [Nocardia asteroides]|uniref:hypothetical protein n=1 Tax=Nocardia asteroides TaxID=1824 RepID=UPI0036677EBF
MSNDPTSALPAGPVRADTPARFGAPQAFTAVTFPVLGGALHLAGAPLSDVFLLLGGCGALGAAVVVTAGDGRRRVAALAGAVLRAAAGK